VNCIITGLLLVVFLVKRTGSDLSESCFTFNKQTIYQEPQEKIRYTGHVRGRHITSKSGHKQQSKVTDREMSADDSESSAPKKKSKLSETGSSLAKRSDMEVLPSSASACPRPRSIMILPDADISEHENVENPSLVTECAAIAAEDLCTLTATRTDVSMEERSSFIGEILKFDLHLFIPCVA